MHISVIVPTYKPKEYLWECLRSLENQTLPKDDFEVILILNGCKEPYESEIRKYLTDKNLLNVQLIQTEQAGVSNARNIGLDLAKGEYISFIDDDDLISENYLESLLSVSSENCVGVSNSYSFVCDIKEKNINFISNAYRKIKRKKFSILNFRSYFSPPICKLIHKSIIGKFRFNTNFKYSEDSLFFALISNKIKNMKCAPENSIYYVRQRKNSATRINRSLYSIAKTQFQIFIEFIRIYLSNIFEYNFLFFATRLLAVIKTSFSYIITNFKSNKFVL